MNLLVKIEQDYLTFSIYNLKELENFNNTNIINVKNIKFSEAYILDNLELVGSFLKVIALKSHISKAIINNIEIAPTILKVLKFVTPIKELKFKEDVILNYTLSNLLLENVNLEYVDCYSMPEYIFDRFNVLHHTAIKIRSEVLTISHFMENNNLDTYSDIYYKKNIEIASFAKLDVEDLIAFLSINAKLKVIKIFDYTDEKLLTVLKLLKQNNKNNIKILLMQDENNKEILLANIDKYSKLNNKYKVKIMISYSKEYKEHNALKQLNFTILKFIVLFVIFGGACIVIGSEYLSKKTSLDLKDQEKTIDKIVEENTVEVQTETIDDTPSQSPSKLRGLAYYTNYKEVFDELLKINKDTIGYLKINNTKIKYPVVQASDNDYYLTRAFDGEHNLAGWIFMDYRNNINNMSKNTIIYGHNVVDDSLMFGSLKTLLSPSWYENKDNQIIVFNTLNENISWQIFSIYTIENTNDYLYANFNNNRNFLNYLKREKGRSIYDFQVDVNENDYILTLSTCYEDNAHRLVVHAKRI